MSQWVFKGLRTGVKSTRYPKARETAEGVSPGMPAMTRLPADLANLIVERCPTGALELEPAGVAVNRRRCIHCLRCVRNTNSKSDWESGYEWAIPVNNENSPERRFGAAFTKSVHILVVDTGDCGACLNEVRQLNNPYYNMHRLGFFFTPSPRHADVLLALGAMSDHMLLPLRKAYAAMPTPKRVMAVGACALTGGIVGRNFICSGRIADAIPVDVEVPGNPPPPLAILHGLLLIASRKLSVNEKPRNESNTSVSHNS